MAEPTELMLTRHTPLTVAVDPVALVITECIAVTSAMRKHARWAHSSVSAILSGGPSPDLGVRNRPGVAVGSGEEDGGWRWGSRSKKGKSLQDNPLMSAFTKLRSELRGCRGMFYLFFGGVECWIMLIIDAV
jgi:brefeldin A-resistance guanine nucleotide exchange factor 1